MYTIVVNRSAAHFVNSISMDWHGCGIGRFFSGSFWRWQLYLPHTKALAARQRFLAAAYRTAWQVTAVYASSLLPTALLRLRIAASTLKKMEGGTTGISIKCTCPTPVGGGNYPRLHYLTAPYAHRHGDILHTFYHAMRVVVIADVRCAFLAVPAAPLRGFAYRWAATCLFPYTHPRYHLTRLTALPTFYHRRAALLALPFTACLLHFFVTA